MANNSKPSEGLGNIGSAQTNNPCSVEKCLLGNKVVKVPEDLCSQEEIFNEVVSMETWDIILNENQRKRLIKFLPTFPELDGEEKLETLRMLFNGENFKFGNPLQLFFKKLEAGCFAPDIAKMSALVKKASYRDYQHWRQRYYYQLLKEVLVSRKKLLDAASVLPPDQPVKLERFTPKPNHLTVESRTKARYFYELQEIREECGELDTSSEDESYPGVPPKLSKKHKKRLQNLESSLSPEMMRIVSTVTSHPGHKEAGSGRVLNPLLATIEITEDKYKEMLIRHQKLRVLGEDHPELDTTGITLEDIVLRTNMSKRSAKPTDSILKKKIKTSDAADKKIKSGKPVPEDTSAVEPIVAGSSSQPLLPPPQFVPTHHLLQSECVAPDMTIASTQSANLQSSAVPEVEGSLDEVDIDVGSDPEGGHIALSGQESKPSDVDTPIQHPQCFFSLLRNLFYETAEQKLSTAKLEEQVRSWVENLTASIDWVLTQDSWVDMVSSALKFLAGDFIGLMGENFVPYLDYREKQQQWQWIGAGRDGEQQLGPLCQQWIDIKDGISMDSMESSQNSPPPPRTPTEWTVRPTTDEEKSVYREQECVRYQNPHKAFTFHIHGYESVVGPVKGVYGKDSGLNKAREHSLLISDRPPFVTILSLVRDAAARLPNGEGTRADICELLKDSQYLSPACDAQINTVVSGALDRLHYEKDPCVKYDVNRKLWIYLHRHRTEEEFERIHQAQAAAAKAKKAIQKTKIPRMPKMKESPRAAAPDESFNNPNSESSTVGTPLNPPTTAVSPRTSSSPRAQSSPKQVQQLVRSLSIPSHATKTVPQVTAACTIQQGVRKQETIASAPPNLSFTLLSQSQAVTSLTSTESLSPLTPKLICSSTSTASSPLASISSQPPNGGNNSRPSSHGSVQSLPSPKTVIANVNAAQLLGVAHLQGASLPEQSSISLSTSGLTINTTTGITNIDMKPSSPAFVGQPPVLQPVLSHSPVIMSSTSPNSTTGLSSSGTPAKVSNIGTTAGKRIHASSILGQTVAGSAPLQGFQTIVIKQEPGSKPSTTIATLPVLTTGAMGSTAKVACSSSKPVVARIVSGTQVVSLGSLVAGSPLSGGKPGVSSAQSATIRIQSGGFVRPVGAATSLNVLPASQLATTSSKFPRLAVVSQVSSAPTSSIAASNTVAGQPKLLAVSQAQLGVLQAASLESLATQESTSLSLSGKPSVLQTQAARKGATIGISASPTTGVAATTIAGKPAVVVASKASAVATGVQSATMAGTNLPGVILASSSGATSQPTVVIATQGALKPTQTYVMAAPGTAPTVVMAASAQQGVRGTTVTPLNMKALQGIKVIPVSQAVTSGKGGKTQPLLARIIAPPGGITLRPGGSVATVGIGQSQQMTSPTAVSIIQGLGTMPVHSVEQGTVQTTAAAKQAALTLPNSSAQPVIVQVQTSTAAEAGSVEGPKGTH